ncbi:CG025 protein, partial [Acromyrmex charruanus]
MEDEIGDELLQCLEEKIASGHSMVERLKLMDKIDGIDKLIRKIHQEIKFLEKVQYTGNLNKKHLQSSNLTHLDAMVARLSCAKDPISVMRPFKYQKSRLEVDIVCNNGASWVKVIARNARALTLISLGNGEYGQKSVLDQANSYLVCSKCHLHHYRPPDVIFHFAYGVEVPLALQLEQMGITVEGDRIETNNENLNKQDELDLSKGSTSDSEKDLNMDLQSLNTSVLSTEIKLLNLDVSALLAYVTNMANGYNNYVYREPLLMQQAEMERKRPIKPILENLFRDKELIICRTAYNNFMNIIDVIGGPNETQRAQELLKKVRIVDDVTTGRIMELRLGGKIKDRSRLIFATGESMKSITVSANEGFVRAARMQGIECTVFLHEPRSLSEVKETNATSIEQS